ncbi:MAG TPA: PEP-CTERM sorting domain-containing protein [Bryobacteraceae bacterium]|nr:PEP-CTERM sorting domain-containing protein [Bryobacteraceae bacterium]
MAALATVVSLPADTITASDLPGSATVISFDDVLGGDQNLSGPSVTNQYASLGVVFNNPTYPGQDTIDTNLTSGIPNASAPNALFVHQGGLLLDPIAAPFQILFSVPVVTVGFDYGSSSDSFLELDAYDSNNFLIDVQTFVGTPTSIGQGGFAGLQESANIARLDVSYHPFSNPSRTFNFSIDNLAYAAPTPEPATWSIVGLGLLAVGAGCWRKSRRQPRP